MKSDNTKTILLIIPSLIKGGAEKIFIDQYVFYSTHCKTIACVFNDDHVEKDQNQFPFISLDVPAGRNILQKAYFFWLRIRRLRKLKKKYAVDVAISHLEGADYVNILSRRQEKIVCWIHGTKKYDKNIEGFLGWIRKNILIPFLYNQKTNTLITVSDGIREELISFFKIKPERVRTLYNGFDLPGIEEKANAASPFSLKTLSEGNPILFTHCRLARQKNLTSLLNIYHLLKPLTCAKLFIVGDGELKDQLYDQGEKLGLRQYAWWKNMALSEQYDLYFLGHHDNPFVLLKQATLFLMTSSWEGFPLALCEAMACHIPVVAADCYTGPREILGPEIKETQPISQPYFSPLGVLMPLANNENYDAWANTTVHILRDAAWRKKLAAGGAQRVIDFDKKNTNKDWLSLIYE